MICLQDPVCLVLSPGFSEHSCRAGFFGISHSSQPPHPAPYFGSPTSLQEKCVRLFCHCLSSKWLLAQSNTFWILRERPHAFTWTGQYRGSMENLFWSEQQWSSEETGSVPTLVVIFLIIYQVFACVRPLRCQPLCRIAPSHSETFWNLYVC